MEQFYRNEKNDLIQLTLWNFIVIFSTKQEINRSFTIHLGSITAEGKIPHVLNKNTYDFF